MKKNTPSFDELPEDLVEVYGATVYVVSEVPDADGTFTVDKLARNKEGRLTRDRYTLFNGTQCTCLGWMKTDNCKHLKMLSNAYEAKGAGSALVVDQIQTLARQYPTVFPDGMREWDPDLEDLPESFGKITFSFPMPSRTVKKIVFVRKWPNKAQVAIIFENSPVVS